MLDHVQTLDLYLPPIPDDTEEAPWMVMSMAQFQAIDAFYDALFVYGQAQDPPWLVASLLRVRYRPNPSSPHPEGLAPDVMVAFVPPYLRDSYDVEKEGKPPSFVLEV